MPTDAAPPAPAMVGTDVGRLADNIGFLAARFTYVAAKVAATTLAPFDLSTRRYTLLELAATGDGLSQRDLGRVLCLDPSNVLRLVDQLEDRGLVARERDAADRRRTIIRATAQGRTLAAEAGDALESAYRDLLGPLTTQDGEDLMTRMRWLGLEVDAHRD